MSKGHECRCPVAEPHLTFGQCMRWKNVRVAYCQSAANKDYTAQKKWDRDLEAYANARRQGIQPDGTTREKVRYAEEASSRLGVAYGTQAFKKKVLEKAVEKAA